MTDHLTFLLSVPHALPVGVYLNVFFQIFSSFASFSIAYASNICHIHVSAPHLIVSLLAYEKSA